MKLVCGKKILRSVWKLTGLEINAMVMTGTIRELHELKCKNNKNMAIAVLQRNRNKYPLIIFNSVWKNGMCSIKNGNYISVSDNRK